MMTNSYLIDFEILYDGRTPFDVKIRRHKSTSGKVRRYDFDSVRLPEKLKNGRNSVVFSGKDLNGSHDITNKTLIFKSTYLADQFLRVFWSLKNNGLNLIKVYI